MKKAALVLASGSPRRREILAAAGYDFTWMSPDADEIEGYIATGSPLDKAGAYGIQDAGGMFVSAIDGDYYTVMGLPICAVSCALREKFGILPFEK